MRQFLFKGAARVRIWSFDGMTNRLDRTDVRGGNPVPVPLSATYSTQTFSDIRSSKPVTNSVQSGTACGASCCLVSSWNARHFILNVYRTQSAGSESPNLALMWYGRDFRLFTRDFPQGKNSCCLVISVLVMFRQAHRLVQFLCCTSDGWNYFLLNFKFPWEVIKMAI
jgi:hypothetical protein